jgi:hypothetical protein
MESSSVFGCGGFLWVCLGVAVFLWVLGSLLSFCFFLFFVFFSFSFCHSLVYFTCIRIAPLCAF